MNIIDRINNSHFITEDDAKFLLRITVAVVVLLHGLFKIQNPMAMDFVAGAFTSIGLPAFLAYLIYVGEVIAPLMLLAGYQTKIAALLIVINMTVAIVLVHLGQVLTRSEMGGGWAIELQALILVGALAVFALGKGKCRWLSK